MTDWKPYDYPYCDFEFDEWNPVQLKCLPHFTERCNLVLRSSTASGKSAVAEAIMGYELASSPEAKAVYVSPLKAIGQEKYAAWSRHPTFSAYERLLVSSDDKASPADFEKARLVVSTVESMSLRCRSRDRWLSKVRALVFDEAHLLADPSRGGGAEAMVMGLTALNPECRVICLSGTMTNHLEIARWLKACNGLSTHYVSSKWRPSRLDALAEVAETPELRQSAVLREARALPEGRKMLVFVHSKAVGECLCRHLRDYGVPAAFYHAGLQPRVRAAILSDFREEYSGLGVLVCTSSLGMGVDI